MRFGSTYREALRRRELWRKHREDLMRKGDLRLIILILEWVEGMEAYLGLRGRHVRDVANQALISSGGLDLSRKDVQRAIAILKECWQYGASLDRWARNNSTWLK